MKKGYMECPYCANEIKIGAKKCQFCKEFLDGRDSEKNTLADKSTEKMGFFYRFFRKDLSLNKKWGHRFLKILFLLSLCVLLVETLVIPSYKAVVEHEKAYKFVEPLRNRFTSELKNLTDLLNDGEIVYNDRVYGISLFGIIFGVFDGKYQAITKDGLSYFYNLYTPNTYYCSTDLANNFSKLKKITGINDVRAYEGSSDTVWRDIDSDINSIKRYINENYIKEYTNVDKIYCVAAKKYPSFDCLDFTWWDISDKYIFREAPFFTRLSVVTKIIGLIIGNALLVLIFSSVIFVIYYKFIIYIIYGSYKKKD